MRAGGVAAGLLRGSVPARGVWIDPRWSAPGTLEARALSVWVPGAVVSALDGGLLVRLPAPVRLACATAPGLVFVEVHGDLWAWVPSEAEAGSAGGGQLHWLREGVPRAIALATLPEVDLARVLLVEGPVAAVTPLGAPPPRLPAAPTPDARARMGRPPADPAALAIAQELARATPTALPKPGWLTRMAGGLLAWLDRGRSGAGGGTGTGAGVGTAATLPAVPPRMSPFEAAARHALARLLAPALGRQHGRYLGELLELFRADDLDAALRRAIPLGGGAFGPPSPPALGVPRPRTDLALSRGPPALSSGIGVDAQLMQLLRDTYQRALDRLVDAGRVEDAAFVLVELLREPRKAIDLLEKHGRWELAAEIAEVARLGPEVIVRLWVRAGQLDRAIRIARRTASFAASVPVVEAADAERGRAFRAAWAAHLAAGGDPAGAVAVCWPVPTLRPLALRWLDDALAAGGTSASRLLPLRLVVQPERFAEVRAHVETLLHGDDPLDVAERVALAEGLAEADSPGARALARPVWRRLVADQDRLPAHVPLTTMQQLQARAADAALTVDQPARRPVPTLAAASLRWTLDAGDRGSAPVRDLAPLPRGRMLLALGEAGCRVVDRTGRVLAVLDEPAYALAVHDAGSRAIAIAARKGGVRLARLDLAAGTAERWIEAPMGVVTRTYDGSLWFVADGATLLALDPLADRAATVWSVDTGGGIQDVVRGPGGISVVVSDPVRQVWRYALPNLRLTERAELPDEPWPYGWLGADATVAQARDVLPGLAPVLPLRLCKPGKAAPESVLLALPEDLAQAVPLRVERTATHGLVVTRTSDRVVVQVFDAAFQTARLRLDLLGAQGVVTRLGPDWLAVGDDLGRSELLSLAHGTRTVRARV